MRPTSQRLADTEAKLARLHDRQRKDHARQMIILGATLMAEARRSPGFRLWLIGKLEAALKPADEGAIRQLVERIRQEGSAT